jgi:2-iminobutanoate/2-iminopropanoate deaminase
MTRRAITGPTLPAPMRGGGMDDVVKVTVFITDMGLYDEIHEVRRSYFDEPYPASSMVEVCALIGPRLPIEIEAVAVLE